VHASDDDHNSLSSVVGHFESSEKEDMTHSASSEVLTVDSVEEICGLAVDSAEEVDTHRSLETSSSHGFSESGVMTRRACSERGMVDIKKAPMSR